MDAHTVQHLTPVDDAAPALFDIGVALADDPARWVDEIDAAVEAGMHHVRIDARWAVLQPRAGRIDGGEVERLRETAQTARDRGLAVWWRLLQPPMPTWFADEGGFADSRAAARWWPRWVEEAADAIGGEADGWVPIEAPYRLMERVAGDDPRRQGDVMHRLVVAWRDAWRILRGVVPVATSLDLSITPPRRVDDDPLPMPVVADQRRRDALRWHTWLGGLGDGIVRIPGRADVELADLAGATDVVGIAITADAAGIRLLDRLLQRVVDMGPARQRSVTVRAVGTSDAERHESVERLREALAPLAAETEVRRLTVVGAQPRPR